MKKGLDLIKLIIFAVPSRTLYSKMDFFYLMVRVS